MKNNKVNQYFKQSASNVIYRKVLTGFLTTVLYSLTVTFVLILEAGTLETLGGEFIGVSLVVSFYVGIVILIYGIPVSFLIEYIFNKKEVSSISLYIFLHMACGMASYFVFGEWGGVLYGLGAAFLFGSIDLVLTGFKMTDTFIIVSIVLPIGMYALLTIVSGIFL